MPPSQPQLFEASWEICNKVGGIHTVITSKLAQVTADFPDSYLGIGPYLQNGQLERSFKALPLPESLAKLEPGLKAQGVSLHYGTWLVSEKPPVVLLGWEGLLSQLNDYKTSFWEIFGLDTLGTDFYDFDQPLLWSIAAGLFTDAFSKAHPAKTLILQTHEWLSGGAILTLAQLKNTAVRTVFTTHATVLGRALSSQGVNLYDKLAALNPDQEAKAHGVLAKHQLEKIAANQATIFTTVSRITAEEAAALLGRKPDVITENGLNCAQFPPFDQLCQKHYQIREFLHDLVSAYFFPHYRFDLQDTSYQFTMGRYEVHNKGFDLYLQSLGQLNAFLKAQKSSQTVVSFFLIPHDAIRLRPETLTKLLAYKQVGNKIDEELRGQERDMYQHLWTRGETQVSLPDQTREQLQELMDQIPANDRPPVSPFELRDGDQDPVVRLARENGLQNREEDRVKILFFPLYLNGFDGIFNIPLYDLMCGFDLGVFPSLYEPWGYTPMESLALGVPAVTSNLAGFGRAIAESRPALPASVFVVDRRNGSPEASAEELFGYLKGTLAESRRAWLDRRMSAYQTIQAFDWKELYRSYRTAYGIS